MIQKNGITLITLIITIVLLLILTGVSISVGEDTIGKTQKMRFETDLRIINTKVSELVEEKTLEELNALGKNIPDKASTALGDKSSEGFRYFDKEGLEALGIQNIYREVIINFSTKEVIDINGIDNDGTMIYTLKGWVDPSLNDDDNTEAPTFNLSKKIYGLNATISIKDIEYKGKSNRGTISYKLNDGIWNEINGNEIPVTVSGTYTIKVTDSSNNSTEKTIEIVLTNQPKLDSGMVPVVYVEAGENESEGHWEIADENGGIWYDYASDSAKWANVMLLDELTVDVNGTDITVTNENKALLAGKEVTTLGSMFVWIPRYMYKIPYQNFHTNNAAEIGIKFLKGTTNIATDDTNETIADPYAESIPVPTEQNNPWIIHPAFTDGSKTNYSHGGWDKEITGIWVAKFEASSSTPDAYGQTTELDVKSIPNVHCWINIEVAYTFIVCRKMITENNIYSLSNNTDAHLMKTTEWGAIAYLTQSKYGYLKKDANGNIDPEQRVWVNPNSDNITGQAGSGTSATATMGATTLTDNYNVGNGPKSSSTGNVFGVYDLVGGMGERFSTYLESASNKQYVRNFKALGPEKKYVEIYPTYENIESEGTIIKWGDAVYETSSTHDYGTPGWHQSFITYINTTSPFLSHGGRVDIQNRDIFCIGNSSGAYGRTTFRPTIIVEDN